MYDMCGQHFQQMMDRSGMVSNPVCGRLNRGEMICLPLLVRG